MILHVNVCRACSVIANWLPDDQSQRHASLNGLCIAATVVTVDGWGVCVNGTLYGAALMERRCASCCTDRGSQAAASLLAASLLQLLRR